MLLQLILMYNESEEGMKIKVLVLKCEKIPGFIFQSKLVVCDVMIDGFLKDQNYCQNSCL